MIFATVPLAQAEGGILAHSLLIAGTRWPKGRHITAADIAQAASAGLQTLVIARLDPTDIGEDQAAAHLAAALAGTNLTPLPAAHGRANIAATAAGILTLDPQMVAAINTLDEALTLATLAPGTRVAAGEIIATVKVIRYAVTAETLAAATAAAAPLTLAAFRPLTIALVSTTLAGTSEKLLAKTEKVTRNRVEAMACTMTTLPHVAHETAALAVILAQPHPADILLIAGASATVDRADVIPAAIIAAGGHIERLGMPVDPGNLLCLGTLHGRSVIGLPGCARSPKRNGFDVVLERLVAGHTVTSHDIAMMGAGGLLPEAERPQPRAKSPPGPVGAIILAAGRSSRMGNDHKLLADWRGKPLVAHVADAIADAGLPPPVIVLGARADEVRAALGNRPAIYTVAADYAEGLSRSLRTGLAAVPATWSAALICLGDMPRVEASLLRALAAAPGDVALPVWNTRRGNPVRWSRRHFARLTALEGDIGGKAVLADAIDLTEVPAPSDAALDDIDTPAALAALQARES
ncbi:4-diphosphocytidyl-2C-methyl-D-erythritol kinase [Polymorphobacter glacialis]|uniref:4-diphosphocytidyl-2C-methyl-D-erythritol kinase n=1 Tax=Sandarakinorhabdus glacialis TaxID=1614636 RepID=A0A917E3F6_9SPHN|nr:NTP transferase domain-containing protein [Polymorphobacter glacialis]GGD99329.1 4-diphosphocytidyl-2C-methyl-D-erythritol kinase [Polymorphobacter glacialis]